MSINPMWPAPGKSAARNYSSSSKVLSSVENITTSPKAKWASQDRYLALEPGGTLSETVQFFATRVKMNPAGGKWEKIALVYMGAYQKVLKSPTGISNTARVTLSATFELANGALQTAYTSTNAGSTAPFQVTFNGSVDGILAPMDLLISDWILPSDLGLSVFEWTDRTLFPWVRTAYSKTGATDLMGVVSIGNGNSPRTEFNYPCNSHLAQCTTYAAAKTLIQQTGIVSYNSGNNFFGATDSELPGPIGLIGVASDGQMSLLVLGTSLSDGQDDLNEKQGGVNPAGNTMYNYDMVGWPCRWAQKLTNSTPVLNLACGSSSMYSWFSNDAANNWASSDAVLAGSKNLLSRIAQYFDVCIANDPNNDLATGTYQDSLYNFTRVIRSQNQSLKIYGCYMPNGYTDIAGTPVAYNASLDALYTAQAAMVTAGYWDGMFNLRGDGTKLYLDSGTQVTSTTTALGSTTTLIDSGQNWRKNQWANSWVSVGGVKKLISGNTSNTLTFGAYGAAVGSGTAYLILGNQSGDGLHPNAFCQRTVFPAKFDSELSTLGINFPRFTRTQS